MPVLAEQAAEQRHEGDANEGDTAASHQLLHTLGLRTVGIEKFSDKHCKTGTCLLYTSDAADDLLCVDLGVRRLLNKKKHNKHK